MQAVAIYVFLNILPLRELDQNSSPGLVKLCRNNKNENVNDVHDFTD